MAAPIGSNSYLSKKAFRYILLGSICLFAFNLLLLYLPLNSKSSFDVIFFTPSAIKTNCSAILLLHIVFQFLLWKFSKPKAKQIFVAKLVPDLLKGFLLFCASVLCFHIIAVLFGAPFFENTAETFQFALLMSSVSVAPPLVHLGLSSESLIKVFIINRPEAGIETLVHLTSLCSVVGAWAGAIVIPLDWDRPWQVWPVSCVIGALLGREMGLLLNILTLGQHYWAQNRLKAT